MKNQEYRSILGQLPLKNPTPEDMARVCPHLTQSQAVEAFTTGEGYVYCPSLRVRHALQIVCYRKEWVEQIMVWRNDTQVVTGAKNHPPRLEWAYSGRTPASYVDGRKHGDILPQHTAILDKAMSFSEANWPEELVLDDWKSFLEIYVQDPTDLVNDAYHRDYPRTKAILYIALKRDHNVIINEDSKPQSELLDEAIAQITTDPLVGRELKGGRGGFTDFNCAHCGGGLDLSSCSCCGHRFRDDLMRCGYDTPLSRKMVSLLRDKGHIFKMDPEIAWGKELKLFEQYLAKRA